MDGWFKAIRDCGEHSCSNRLSDAALADHLESVFSFIMGALKYDQNGKVKRQARESAYLHGKTRWEEGARPEDLVVELSLLRVILIHLLFDFMEANQALEIASCVDSVVALHCLLDEMIRSSIHEYERVAHRII